MHICCSSLEFVQVWFRHGERTPTKYPFFPSEPSNITSQFPTEPGELTTNGMRMEYKLGQKLKEAYGQFLGDVYRPHDIRIYMDEDNRTSTSAQCVMAGFYPPKGEFIWNEDLLWQPVAQHEQKILAHVSVMIKVSTGVFDHCSKLGAEIKSSEEFSQLLANADQELTSFLAEKSGFEIANIKMLNDVADALVTRTNINDSRYPVPSWMNSTLYPKMKNISTYVHTNLLDLLKSSSGVWHVTKLISGIESHLARQKRNRAEFLSGHDTNILALCRFLGIKDCSDEMSFYGSHLSFELHTSTRGYVLKTYYSSQYDEIQHKVVIPECGETCYWATFRDKFGKKRITDGQWWEVCSGKNHDGVLSGALLITCIILFISTIVLLYTTCSYKKQLQQMNDSERTFLLN